MDAFIDLVTQAPVANLLAQVNFLTKQLQNGQFHNAEFEASDVQVTLPCVGILMGLI